MHGEPNPLPRRARTFAPTFQQARAYALGAVMVLSIAALVFAACVVLLAAPAQGSGYCDHAGAFESALGGWTCSGCRQDVTHLYEVTQ